MNKLLRAIRLYKPIPIEEGCAEKCRPTHHNYFKLTAKITIALLAVLIATTVPKTAFSQSATDCEISGKGTVGAQGGFQLDPSDNDFKITCAATANLDSINDLIKAKLGEEALMDESQILIEISQGNNGQIELDDETLVHPYTIIFSGTIENSGNYGTAISVNNYRPGLTPADIDVDVENHAMVTTGDGRRGFSIEAYGTSSASFTNYETIETSGDVHQRPYPAYKGNWPNRRSDGVHVTSYDTAGDVELINLGTVTVEAKAASGLNGGVAGTDYDGTVTPSTGSVTIDNHGTVTTTGDAHEFPVSVGNPNVENIKRAYRPYGVQAYIDNKGTGAITITNKSGAVVRTEGRGSRGISAYSDGPGLVTVINEGADGDTAAGTVTNEGGAWQASTESFMSSPNGLYGNSGGGGIARVENRGIVSTGHMEHSAMAVPEAIEMAISNINGRSSGDPVAQADLDAIGVSGTFGNALYALSQGKTSERAVVINSGTITTWGYKAHGMRTWTKADPENVVTAEGTNEASGMITTHGSNADGMLILAASSTNADSSVTATNEGTITVNGDSAVNNVTNGISAGFIMDRDADGNDYSEDALGTVTVTNTGTVNATGEGATAISAGFWAAQGNTIENSGDVVININEGSTVTASGNNSTALYAETHGSGNVDINVVNGNRDPGVATKITAGSKDDTATDEDEAKFGYGIYATANTDSSEDDEPSSTATDNDVDITVDGEIVDGAHSITIQAYGAATDDTSTTGIDETKGIAIYADSGGMFENGNYTGTGRSNISITNANVIGGDQGSGYAVIFKGGPGTLTLDNSKLEGDILFTDADDTFTINDSAGDCTENSNVGCAQFTGTTRPNGGSSIHFGDGTDVMEINANHFKMDLIDITGYPTINFNGDGDDRTLTLQDVRFNVAGIKFMGDDANDTLSLHASDRDSSINGDIDFGGGEDTLNINVGGGMTFDLMGMITNLETMNKRGPGTARVNDVVFKGSELRLDGGQLIVSGTLNLGKHVPGGQAGGTLIIGDMGKLVFEVESAEKYGSVTAEDVIFESATAKEHEVFVQLSQHVRDVDVADVQAAVDGLKVLDVNFVKNYVKLSESLEDVSTLNVMSESTDGTVTMVGSITVDAQTGTGAAAIIPERVTMIEKTGVAAVEMPMAPGVTVTPPAQGGGGGGTTPIPAASSSSGGGGGGGAILGLGLLAVLLNSFVGDDDASASFGDYYFNTPQSAYIASINERGVMTIKETGNQPYQMWIRTGHTAQPMRMTGVSNSGVSGTEVGVNLYNSDTFYINTSVAPNVAAEVGSLNLAGKGEVYSLSSGWRNDRYFGGLRVSHGEFEVNSIVDNPIVNSALISNAKLRNTQAQLRAGMNLGTGALRFTPSAAVQVGTYESSEHVADSPALEAAIPSYAQDYTSVQLGLKMTSDKWLSFSNGSKWKPQLKFDSIHTDSTDAGNLTLRQSDKAGALSFNTNAGLRSMPDVVNSMSFGAKVKSSTNDQAEWKFGFAGLEADGEEYYAAMAAYQLRF